MDVHQTKEIVACMVTHACDLEQVCRNIFMIIGMFTWTVSLCVMFQRSKGHHSQGFIISLSCLLLVTIILVDLRSTLISSSGLLLHALDFDTIYNAAQSIHVHVHVQCRGTKEFHATYQLEQQMLNIKSCLFERQQAV